eukprot:2425729-Rhodomonas_salina.4
MRKRIEGLQEICKGCDIGVLERLREHWDRVSLRCLPVDRASSMAMEELCHRTLSQYRTR